TGYFYCFIFYFY
ncbi:hypothetical protein A2U01_0098347, partial [Trifolium medium]|nr:hypothetical protein [Trifolium medium]